MPHFYTHTFCLRIAPPANPSPQPPPPLQTEDVSYVSSAYIPLCLRQGGRPTLSNAHRAHESAAGEVQIKDVLDEVTWSKGRWVEVVSGLDRKGCWCC